MYRKKDKKLIMKKSTFEKRTSGVNKRSNAYKYALQAMTTGKRVDTCHTSGRGRFTSNIDSTSETIELLERVGLKRDIDFIQENDSPRGGACGNYVALTASGRRKMIKE